MASLTARPPDPVIAANYALDSGKSHPVWDWVQEHYLPVKPRRENERKYFTFYVPKGSGLEFLARMGAGPP